MQASSRVGGLVEFDSCASRQRNSNSHATRECTTNQTGAHSINPIARSWNASFGDTATKRTGKAGPALAAGQERGTDQPGRRARSRNFICQANKRERVCRERKNDELLQARRSVLVEILA